MSVDALITEVLQQARGIAEDVQRRVGVRMRTATVTSADPLRIRYDGEDDASVVTPRTVVRPQVGDRVAVAKTRGQATVLGVLGGTPPPAPGPWVVLPTVGDWEPYSGGGNYLQAVRARRVEAGVQVHAMIRRGEVGSTMFYMPQARPELQPQYAHQVNATANGSENAVVYFNQTGEVSLLSGPSTISYLNINVILAD